MSDEKMPTKGEVLAAIDRERDMWETLLVEVGEARMLEPGAMGDWTFKDLAAQSPAGAHARCSGWKPPPTGSPSPTRSGRQIGRAMTRSTTGSTRRTKIAYWVKSSVKSRESYARLAEIVQMLPTKRS